MPKKKSPKKKSILKNRSLQVASLILLAGIVAAVLFMNNGSNPSSKTTTEVSQEVEQKNLKDPAVEEAKTVANKYFEAARNCDLEAANSHRLLPKNITQTKAECQAECPGGITYKYIKAVSYNQSESDGVTIEFATFDYVFGCGDKTYPTLMQMIRSSEDNIWQVFNMG